jgi:hypothetical protein
MSDATGERRSLILVFFTFVANLYLVAFAADALVSVADDLWFMAAGASPLSEVRNTLALYVVIGSLAMIFVVTFVPQLPKLVFVPLIVAALWLALGGPPFTTVTSERTVTLFLGLIQLIIATAAFLVLQLKAGRALLSAQMLPRQNHVLLRIAFAAAIVLALIPVGLAGLGAWAVVSATETQTKGYIQFTWSEVQSRATVMRNNGKTVHLIATAHIAERSFYEEIYAGIPPHAVILAEGISDRNGLLGGDKSRGEAAGFLGLQTQEVFEALLGPAVSEDTAGAPVVPAKEAQPAQVKSRPDVVRADIDVSELSPPTLRCLREDVAFGDAALNEDEDRPEAPTCSAADRKVFWDEILYTRNNRLLATFDKLSEKYDVFIVPWGALHMPDLELAFKERGFRVARTRMLTLARYQTVAGHVFGGLSAFKLRGPANRPYDIRMD